MWWPPPVWRLSLSSLHSLSILNPNGALPGENDAAAGVPDAPCMCGRNVWPSLAAAVTMFRAALVAFGYHANFTAKPCEWNDASARTLTDFAGLATVQ